MGIRNRGVAYLGGSRSGSLMRLQSSQGLTGAGESPPKLTVMVAGRFQFFADNRPEALVPTTWASPIELLMHGNLLPPENVMRVIERKKVRGSTREHPKWQSYSLIT